MPVKQIHPNQIIALQKSMESVAGDDQEKLGLIAKSFEQLQQSLEDTEVVKSVFGGFPPQAGGGDEHPVIAIQQGVFDAVQKLNAAALTPADYNEALAEVLTKAADAHGELFDAAIEAGVEQGFVKARGGKTPAANPDDPDDDGDDDSSDEQDVGKAAGGELEDVMKNLPTAVQKAFTDMQADNADLRKSLNAVIEKDQKAEFAARATACGQPAEWGETLRAVAKAIGDDEAKKLEAEFSKKNAVVRKSALFAEVGGAGAPEGTTALGQLQAHATEIRKAAPTITQAKAFLKACEDHPDLYNEHQREARGSSR